MSYSCPYCHRRFLTARGVTAHFGHSESCGLKHKDYKSLKESLRLRDAVTCKLCGRRLHNITGPHLKSCKGNSESLTLKEYINTFGKYSNMSESYREVRIKTTIDNNKRRFEDPEERRKQGEVLARCNRNIRNYPGWLEACTKTLKTNTNLEYRRKGAAAKWANTGKDWFYENFIKKGLAAQRGGKKNKLEARFEMMCKYAGYDNLVYTGNGSFKVGRKFPDFVCEGKRLAIDLHGDYWHKGEDIREKYDYYVFEHKWRYHVIWESEFYEDMHNVMQTVGILLRSNSWLEFI